MRSATTDAICCACGLVRRASDKGRSSHDDPYSGAEGRSPTAVLQDRAQGIAVGMEPYWRCLRLLKCRRCGERTRHALIRQDEHRNNAELQDRADFRLRRRLSAHLQMLEAEGVAVRWDTSEEQSEFPVELMQFRDEGGVTWLVSLDSDAGVRDLWPCLQRAEDAIFEGELPFPWRQNEEDHTAQWRGRRFRRGL